MVTPSEPRHVAFSRAGRWAGQLGETTTVWVRRLRNLSPQLIQHLVGFRPVIHFLLASFMLPSDVELIRSSQVEICSGGGKRKVREGDLEEEPIKVSSPEILASFLITSLESTHYADEVYAFSFSAF